MIVVKCANCGVPLELENPANSFKCPNCREVTATKYRGRINTVEATYVWPQ